MYNPYPWSKEKHFRFELMVYKVLAIVATVIAVIVSAVCSPLGILAILYNLIAFRMTNNSRRLRPLIIMGLGFVLSLVTIPFIKFNPFHPLMDLSASFGNKATMSSGDAFIEYLFYGAPIALFFAGVASYFLNAYSEYSNRRFLRHSKPTLLALWRERRAKKDFAVNHLDPDIFELGAVKDDIIPWRDNRRGMIVGKPFTQLKHGYIIGANGAGKTITAMNVIAEYVENGWSVVIPDFKGDHKTENMAAAVARDNGVPFYSFWSNDKDTGFHYDPLLGVQNVSPASIIITAFDFPVDGPAKYYTDQAEKYLALQFSVLGHLLDKNEDESTFDWLLRTVNPDVLKGMLTSVAGSKDSARAEEAKRIIIELGSIKRTDLSSLEANLSKMVNTIGDKMRPSDHMIDFRKAADEGAIVYFGLPSGGDKIIMRALGALLLRDMVSYMSERQNLSGNVGRPILVIPDEASQLQEKAEVMLEILQQGRSARIFLMPVMQTFGSFTEKFIRELLGNSPTHIIMRVSDEITIERICDNLGSTTTITSRQDVTNQASTFGSEVQRSSGSGANTLVNDLRIPHENIMNLDDWTAFVLFSESPKQATLKKSRWNRVRKDETARDIPIVNLFSRQYILDANKDAAVDFAGEMLRLTLNGDEDLGNDHEYSVDLDGAAGLTLAEPVIDPFDEDDARDTMNPFDESEIISENDFVGIDRGENLEPEPVIEDEPVVKPRRALPREDEPVEDDDMWGDGENSEELENSSHIVEKTPKIMKDYNGTSPTSEQDSEDEGLW